MKIDDYFKVAITAPLSNKTRSFLAVLGIVIGISAVIVMISLGQGVQGLILSEIESLGSNTIFVLPGGPKQEKGSPQISIEMFELKTLTYEDSLALERSGVYIRKSLPAVASTGYLTFQNKKTSTELDGVPYDYLEIISNKIIEGRFFNFEEDRSLAKVAVVGTTVREKLFGESDAIGQIIKINKKPFGVIGVIEVMGGSMPFADPNDAVLIPFTVAQKEILGIDHVSTIVVKSESVETLDLAIEETKKILRQRHNILNPIDDDFTILDPKSMAESFSYISTVLTVFLSFIATISLIVGGIGIMNIMLVSVAERMREIGLRRAVGATKKDILFQFLLESIVLTILGGIIGIIVGLIFSFLIGIAVGILLGANLVFSIPTLAIVIAFLVSAFIGLVFGIYPAKKASELSPIEALKYE